MEKPRIPERCVHYSTPEGEIRGNWMPPCPEWIQSREKQALWAKVATILSTRHPMKAGKIRHLEDVFRDLVSAPYPSPSRIARKVNMRWIEEATKQRPTVSDTPEVEA